jgi:hypothetical protein
MRYLKLNGILGEIVDRYPNIDVVEFLQNNLQIPVNKAEDLAARIEKQFCQKRIGKPEQNQDKANPEKLNECKMSSRISAYSVDCLSEKEFERFIKWLLEELGYEMYPGKCSSDLGVNFKVVRGDEKSEILSIRPPKNNKTPNSIVLKTEEAARTNGCQRSKVITSSYFSQQAIIDAQKLNVELWDRDTIATKIDEARNNAELEQHSCFPPYRVSLLQSLLRLEETKDFIIEPKADEKFDLHLPGVKYPLLTFQAQNEEVIRCVFRIKYNEPVGEFDGEALIRTERNNDRYGPDGNQAYDLIIKYLEQFME